MRQQHVITAANLTCLPQEAIEQCVSAMGFRVLLCRLVDSFPGKDRIVWASWVPGLTLRVSALSNVLTNSYVLLLMSFILLTR